MGLLFTAASSQYLVCSNPGVTDYPFSVGMWLRLTAAGSVTRTLFGLSDTGTTNNLLQVRMSTTEILNVVATAGGTENTAGTSNAITGLWAFCVTRCLSSTLRRIHIFVPGFDPITANGTSTTARAPTGMDTITLGARSISSGVDDFWDGIIAEYWLARGDIQGDSGSAPPAALMTTLALNGPFAMGHINVVDYLSLRSGFPVPGDEAWSALGHKWSAVGGPRAAWHPPLSPGYMRPGQTKRLLLV